MFAAAIWKGRWDNDEGASCMEYVISSLSVVSMVQESSEYVHYISGSLNILCCRDPAKDFRGLFEYFGIQRPTPLYTISSPAWSDCNVRPKRESIPTEAVVVAIAANPTSFVIVVQRLAAEDGGKCTGI